MWRGTAGAGDPACQAAEPDLLILDIAMPVLDGFAPPPKL
jgi:CheY-like chemotaxis protein